MFKWGDIEVENVRIPYLRTILSEYCVRVGVEGRGSVAVTRVGWVELYRARPSSNHPLRRRRRRPATLYDVDFIVETSSALQRETTPIRRRSYTHLRPEFCVVPLLRVITILTLRPID